VSAEDRLDEDDGWLPFLGEDASTALEQHLDAARTPQKRLDKVLGTFLDLLSHRLLNRFAGGAVLLGAAGFDALLRQLPHTGADGGVDGGILLLWYVLLGGMRVVNGAVRHASRADPPRQRPQASADLGRYWCVTGARTQGS
jgi:hypothetical protein